MLVVRWNWLNGFKCPIFLFAIAIIVEACCELAGLNVNFASWIWIISILIWTLVYNYVQVLFLRKLKLIFIEKDFSKWIFPRKLFHSRKYAYTRKRLKFMNSRKTFSSIRKDPFRSTQKIHTKQRSKLIVYRQKRNKFQEARKMFRRY